MPMEHELRRISVTPESELALLIKETVASGQPLVVDTGDESYRLEVSPASEPAGRPSLRHLAHRLAGSLAHAEIPGWESSEAVEEWVENLRQADTYPLTAPQHQ